MVQLVSLKIKAMKKNLSLLDRIIRIILGIAIGVLWYTGTISGTVAIIGLIVAGIFIATSFISFCPLYFAFGLSTRKKD